MKPGKIFLVPVTLGDDDVAKALPEEALALVRRLAYFVVENEKTARRFLSAVKTDKPIRELSMSVLNEHTDEKMLPELLAPVLAGHDLGLMSEAGCPGIADPGAQLVALAHRRDVPVKPLVGPSSILLALMASGFNGQCFSFVGYLPSEKTARINRLRELEQRSRKHAETQIFIETPYRNQHLLEDIVATCADNTRICVASNISLATERIVSKRTTEWKKAALPDLHRQPTVFLLLA